MESVWFKRRDKVKNKFARFVVIAATCYVIAFISYFAYAYTVFVVAGTDRKGFYADGAFWPHRIIMVLVTFVAASIVLIVVDRFVSIRGASEKRTASPDQTKRPPADTGGRSV